VAVGDAAEYEGGWLLCTRYAPQTPGFALRREACRGAWSVRQAGDEVTTGGKKEPHSGKRVFTREQTGIGNYEIHRHRFNSTGAMIDEVRLRLRWVQLYLSTGDAGVVCRRCGISRPTLRKWIRRYKREGEAGLANRSRRPRRSPQRTLFQKQSTLILRLRREQNMGARHIQSSGSTKGSSCLWQRSTKF
jgi:transposase-like protein